MALRDAAPLVYWLDALGPVPRRSPLPCDDECDLLIVGGGYTGLWAAHHAVVREPNRSVMVLEGETVAFGASGRNGGFCDASLTHGVANGLAHHPRELDTLLRLGRDNLTDLRATVAQEGIDARYEAVGQLEVAREPWQVNAVRQEVDLLVAHGEDAVLLDREATLAEVRGPDFLASCWHRSNVGLVDPARLALGLADAVERRGVRVHERSAALGIESEGAHLVVRTQNGRVRARRVLLATNAFPGLVRSIRRRVVPVWDYVLVTEPMSDAQRATLGWEHRQGLAGVANQFHYYRLIRDDATGRDRLLWGGYDAVHHLADRVDVVRREQRADTFDRLAAQLFATFPQLDGLRVTHRWGGPIATTSQFCVTFGTAFDGRASFAVGYTGLGVAASRFGARVALDLIDDPSSELARLGLVRRPPMAFPPEPLRYGVIALTRRALERADAHEGRRGLWLRLLDRVGVGFDS